MILLNYRTKKTKIEFAKEMYFDEKAVGNKSGRDKTPIRLLKSPATMARSLKRKLSSKTKTKNLEESKTRWLSSDTNERCDRIRCLLLEKEAAINSNTNIEKIAARTDKLLEKNCISTKQHSQFLNFSTKLFEDH